MKGRSHAHGDDIGGLGEGIEEGEIEIESLRPALITRQRASSVMACVTGGKADEKAAPVKPKPQPRRTHGLLLPRQVGDEPQDQCRIAHRMGQKADAILRRRERHGMGQRHGALGRLEAHHAAAGHRKPDRAAGVRAQGHRDKAKRHGRGAAAGRAAGDGLRMGRIGGMP